MRSTSGPGTPRSDPVDVRRHLRRRRARQSCRRDPDPRTATTTPTPRSAVAVTIAAADPTAAHSTVNSSVPTMKNGPNPDDATATRPATRAASRRADPAGRRDRSTGSGPGTPAATGCRRAGSRRRCSPNRCRSTARIPARIVAVHARHARTQAELANHHHDRRGGSAIVGIRYGQYEPVPKIAWMIR